ncbi:Astacin (Peptidase M12A) family protein [Brugia pahangi]
MITIVSFVILLTGGFRIHFTELIATKLTAIDIQGKLNRISMSKVIQTEDGQLTWKSDEEYDDSEQDYDTVQDDTEAMYREDLFEGDIVLISNGATIFNRGVSMTGHSVGCKSRNNFSIPQLEMNAVQHNAVRQKTLLWRNGRVPYVISSVYANISKLIILEAFKEYRHLTCIRFVPKRRFDSDYIYIAPYDGCYSMVGNNGGRQTVSLGDGCLKKGIVIHELMHVIGFFHEQNRADRDLYVDILWENVKPALSEQFDKYSATIIDDLGSPYDYDSVTHYSANAFSKNVSRIGQRRGLSFLDIWKINKLYDCIKQGATTSASNAENGKEHKELEVSGTIIGQFPTTIRTATISSTSSANNIKTRTKDVEELKINLNLSTSSTLSPTFMSASVNNFTLHKMHHCNDRHPYCQILRTSDFCTIYPRFVHDYCALSCGRLVSYKSSMHPALYYRSLQI